MWQLVTVILLQSPSSVSISEMLCKTVSYITFWKTNSGEPRAAQEVRPLWGRIGQGVGLLRVRVRLRLQVRVRPPLQQTAQRVRETQDTKKQHRYRHRGPKVDRSCQNTRWKNEMVALLSIELWQILKIWRILVCDFVSLFHFRFEFWINCWGFGSMILR